MFGYNTVVLVTGLLLCVIKWLWCMLLKEDNISFRTNTGSMEKGLELSKRQLQAIITQVQTFLDMHQVISAGPFLYAFMEEVRSTVY